MSHADAKTGRVPLGVGKIIGESFSIFFRKFWKMIVLAGAPILALYLLLGALNGFGESLGGEKPVFDTRMDVAVYALAMLLNVTLLSLISALLVLLAYDVKQGRSRPVGTYFAKALPRILPLAVLSVVVTVLFGIGLALLIVPGLWIYAACVATYPAIVIEDAGFRALSRSVSLTKGYRWPIVGVLIVIGIVTYALNFAGGFAGGFAYGIGGAGMIVVALLVNTFANAVMYGLGAVAVALIYARLREIKEGVTVVDLAAVFD